MMQTEDLLSERQWKKYFKICLTKVAKNYRYVSFKILLFLPVYCKKL
jgi:hypothetical protein